MKRILTVYPNCSLGGMATVYMNRCRLNRDVQFDFIFTYDKGAKSAYENIYNADVRIVRKDRLNNFLINNVKNIKYNAVYVTSFPQLTQLDIWKDVKLIYEFHTSSVPILEKELKELNFSAIHEINVPSEWLKNVILGLLSNNKTTIKVVENIVDTNIFNAIVNHSKHFYFDENTIPIFWVGRFDKGKNYKDFFRLLSLLPQHYCGVMVLGLESDPVRFSEALSEMNTYHLNGRIQFLLNLYPVELATLYKDSFSNQGIFCSTSLQESFGYGVLEAALCGLPVVTYEVGGISGHKKYGLAIHFVDVGDTIEMSHVIQSIQWRNDFEQNVLYSKKYMERLK
ncbi:MAG: glycosyltransferase family 4 protein [Neisseriaceae bacterium]|nr:glycosyltransferase family 4 protein [Neisseriaceae bacterium]